MPIYEYQCNGCGHQFETLVLPAFPAACPRCQGQDLKRMISLFAVDSENVRQSNLTSERRRTDAVRREKQDAQAKYEERVRKDH